MSAFITNVVAASRREPIEDCGAGCGEHTEPARENPGRKQLLQRLLRDPMLHFIVAGAIIFGVTQAIGAYRDHSARTIVVDDALRNRLGKLYTLQLGATPTDAQLTGLIDTYVHDEVLYREGLALGLDQGDEIIRRRLVQKMGFLQSDLIIAADPDEKTLRDYYQHHAPQFAEPAKVDFQQYFFGGDGKDQQTSQRRAAQALAQLNGAGSASPVAADQVALASEYRQLDRPGLTRLFGATPIVDALLPAPAEKNAQAPVGEWQGPFQSGYGWHLVRVSEREEPAVPPFETVRAAVAEVVRAQQKEENNRRSFEQLRARYDVQYAQQSSPAVTP
jgi:hypothetical protein